MRGEELILGYRISVKSKEVCVSDIIEWLKNGKKNKYFVCANPHSLEVARTDSIFQEAMKWADLAVPDGIGIVIASIILAGKIRRRVTGSDIFLGLSEKLNDEKKYSYFFLGSTEENLQKISNKMRTDFPGIKVVGTYSPPFKTDFSVEDNQLMVEAVNRSHPDVLWVGLTAPKQEKWIYQNKDRLNVRFIGAIGAVFDFYTGNVKRSHPFFQKIGLEWLPRLLSEPLRLWRRNFISNPSFMIRVISGRIAGKKQRR